MDTKKLVKMVNEISAFFEAEPDHAAAVEGVTNHLARFWEPRMRRELLVHVDETQGEGLKPLVLEAIQTNRERLAPAAPQPR